MASNAITGALRRIETNGECAVFTYMSWVTAMNPDFRNVLIALRVLIAVFGIAMGWNFLR